MVFIELFQISYQGFVSYPPIWVFRFLEVVLWCVLINMEGFPLPYPSLQFPLCAWNSNSTTSLCLYCIYSYAPFIGGSIYLFICLLISAGRGWEPHRKRGFGILAGTAQKTAAPPMRDIFLSLLLFPTSWSSQHSYFQFANMSLQVRL